MAAAAENTRKKKKRREREQTVGPMEWNGGIGPLLPRNERGNGSRF